MNIYTVTFSSQYVHNLNTYTITLTVHIEQRGHITKHFKSYRQCRQNIAIQL